MTKVIVIGATGSGVGKTSISVGLARLFSHQGLRVQTFKVGPDYLDPGFLTAASGRPCYNVDRWMMGENAVRTLVNSACEGMDLAIVEGVMGLYDGADAKTDEGTTSQMAKILGAKVLLILDAGGCARTFAAVADGMTSFVDAPQFLGLIANKIGSEYHKTMLADSLLSMRQPLPLLGGVHKNRLPSLPSRHLGLTQAMEMEDLDGVLDQMASVLEGFVDFQEILALAPVLNMESSVAEVQEQFTGLRLAIAKDEAFSFYYPDLWAALKNYGVEICEFSPLHDTTLPAGVGGVILGGGYPEIHAQALAANESMLNALRDFAQQCGPIYAECGGLMYLSRGIHIGAESVPLCGILPAWTQMQEKLQRLGYVQVELNTTCVLGEEGEKFRGHEFHYSVLCEEPEGWQKVYDCTDARGQKSRVEGYSLGSVLASYVHLPLASYPAIMTGFLRSAAKFSKYDTFVQ